MKILNLSIIFISLTLFACGDCTQPEVILCGGSDSRPQVDLVVIMDQSGSMRNEAEAVSGAAESAIMNAIEECNTDLRVEFLAVGSVSFPTTVFQTTVLDYLEEVDSVGVNMGIVEGIFDLSHQEDGASSMTALSRHYDWRNRACRSIFYISDEPVHKGEGVAETTETAAANLAIESAIANEVALFTNAIDEGNIGAFQMSTYNTIADETKGRNFISQNVTSETYLELMPEVICNSCNACRLNEFVN